MKKRTKFAAAASAAVLLLNCAAPVLPSSTDVQLTAVAADDNNDDWLHAVGSRLYDKNGNEVWITGANWFGFNCGERFPHGLWSADIDNILSSIADKGINTLRFPVATELILDWMDGVDDSDKIATGINPQNGTGFSFNPSFCKPDGGVMTSHEVFDVILDKCKKYGIKVFVDIHSPALHNSGHNYNLWYHNSAAGDADNMAITESGVKVTSKMWKDSLVWLADQYKNNDTLIAFDLKNEPHGKCPEGVGGAKWDGSTDENNWAYASTDCALAMLDKNPNALILIEGVEQYPREGHKWGDPDSRTDPPAYGGWWGGQFRGVRDYPIDLGKYQSQLVYSPHDYGPGVYAQTWFDKDFTEQTLLDDYWYDTWAFINEEDIAPLLIGEWGGFMDGGKNEQWLTLLREYMIKHHINHTFWCINPNSGDTGGLLGYDFATWDSAKYELMEPSLWQTQTSGKYIGLDHQTPLGKNGLSLNEFYSKYSASEGSNLDGGKKSTGNVTDDPTPATTTTAAAVTTAKTTTTVTTTPKPATTTTNSQNTTPGLPAKYGDANCDGDISISDAVLILQAIANADEYGLGGKNEYCLSQKGAYNADCYDPGSDITSKDALAIQRYLVHLTDLPEYSK